MGLNFGRIASKSAAKLSKVLHNPKRNQKAGLMAFPVVRTSMLVDIHHAAPSELRQRVMDVRECHHPGSVAEIFATGSRNELLARIAARPIGAAPSVSLVDLRLETGDIEQVGLRIVETIRRHPSLSARTRPLVWTEHITSANVSNALAHGAYGLISDAWVDLDSEGELVEALDWAAGLENAPIESCDTLMAWPPITLNPEAELIARDASFVRWFDFEPNEVHYHLLWGMANAIELEFLKEYLVRNEIAPTKTYAKKNLERLQSCMTPQVEAMDRPEPARAELARRFLAEQIPPQPDPLDEISWPKIDHVADIWHDDEVAVKLAFLDQLASKLLPQFLFALEPSAGGGAVQYEAISHAVKHVAETNSLTEAHTHGVLHRATHNLDDSWRDIREHGVPKFDK